MLARKLNILQDRLAQCGSCLVAFSGGVDSTFLLKVALDTLGRQAVVAVTAISASLPAEEAREAQTLAISLGAQQVWLETTELEHPQYRANRVDRCYFCKQTLFTGMDMLAIQLHIPYILYGAILDDVGDDRPGQRAADEFAVLAPLQEAGLTKSEIRLLSKSMGLPTWNKPQLACLASRIPHGTMVTAERLARIEQAERLVRRAGFRQVRVRDYDQVARIEVEPAEIPRLQAILAAGTLVDEVQRAGFGRVECDPIGYRSKGRIPRAVMH